MRLWAAWLLSLAMAAAGSARADVWGYVDERGVAHLAAQRVDDRYELFVRMSPPEPSSNASLEPEAAATPLPQDASRGQRLLAFLASSPRYLAVAPELARAARKHGLDQELLKALIATESGFDAAAVSPKGAVGLMQVMPDTALRFGLGGRGRETVPSRLTHAPTNLDVGSRYLRYLIGLFPGDLQLALAAYNAGEGAVQRAGRRIPNYPETQNYVKTVMQLYALLKPPPPVAAAASGSQPAASSAARKQALVPGTVPGRGNMVPLLALPPPATNLAQ